MADPNLTESAWQRAKSDAGGIYKSATFGVALAIMELLAVPAAVLATIGHHDTATQVAVPVLSGGLALALAFIIVLVVQLAAAPVRQRNELRAAWETPAIETVNIDLTLRNAHRKGNDLAKHLEGKQGTTKTDQGAAEQWADHVVDLMACRVPDYATRDFLSAGKDENGPVRRLRVRVDALQKIIDNLG